MNNGREDTNPWTHWFWNDWTADTGLRACGVAEKGLWFEMLGIMARSSKRGYLLDGDKQMDNKTLAKLVGESEAYVDQLLNELRKHGVFSETPKGVIFNRRMVRESAISFARSEAGKKGMESRWKSYQTDNKRHNKPITPCGNGYGNSNGLEEKEGGVGGEEIGKIIEYLNQKTGKKYRPGVPKTRQFILARIKQDKATLDDFKKVIDTKTAEWLGTENDKYLRPETLFGTKFESYLNQRPGLFGAVARQAPDHMAALKEKK